MVVEVGLEPTRLSALASKTNAAANYAIRPKVADVEGVEPSSDGSKPTIMPLYETPVKNIVHADVELHHMERDEYLLSSSGSFPLGVATLRHSSCTKVVVPRGVEPLTNALKARCSAN